MTRNGPSELSVLVAAERGLETELAAAKAEGGRLVEEARREAAELAERLAADVAAALAALQAEMAAERARRVAEIAAESARVVARYDGVGESRVAELADAVVADLVSGGREPQA